MKQAILIVLAVLCLRTVTYGQAVTVTASAIKPNPNVAAPSGACPRRNAVLIDASTIYVCPESGAQNWTAVSGGGGGGVTIGTTTITGGTNTKVLYNNSGVFGSAPINVNALNSTYLDIASAASGSGVTLAVAGGGTNENLIFSTKGTGDIIFALASSQTRVQITNSGGLVLAGSSWSGTAPGSGQIFVADATTIKASFYQNGGGTLSVSSSGQLGFTGSSNGFGTLDTSIARHAASILRVTNGSTGAGQLLIGTSSDTVSAQLDVRSQSTTRPAGRFQAASGTSANQEVIGQYDGSGSRIFYVDNGGQVFANHSFNALSGGSNQAQLHSSGLYLQNAGVVSFSSTSNTSGPFDVTLVRDAANTLAQRNGTNAQEHRTYRSFTDSSNYSTAFLDSGVTTAGTVTFGSKGLGTGASTLGAFNLVVNGTSRLNYNVSTSNVWNMNAGLVFATDNSYDIGASGANRPRNYYGAGDVSIGNGANFYWQNRSVISSLADGTIRFTNAATTDFDRLQFGGTSASFPALKRSGAGLQVRLADDTGYASIATSIVNLDKTITAGGTTGAQTINKSSGTINFAAAATSLVVTNSLVTTSSNIICTVQTNDATMKDAQCVPGSGSFTIYANAAATAETRVGFVIFN